MVMLDLESCQQSWIESLKMEASIEDIKTNPDAKRLAKYINRKGKMIDKANRLIRKIFEYE